MAIPTLVLIALTAGLSLVLFVQSIWGTKWQHTSYFGFVWAFLIAFTVAELGYFRPGNWILGVLSFLALREFFSMIDFRLQDRLAVLGAYAFIPFMFHFVTIDWYGMFIVSIPVYGFLTIPLLISLNGKETEGTIFSIGIIFFGMFLFVYCMGHISYLMRVEPWMAVMLILNVALCDFVMMFWKRTLVSDWRKCALQYLTSIPVTLLLTFILSQWTEIPIQHSLMLGLLIPLLVQMGHRTGTYVEEDLGIQKNELLPGRGQIMDHLKSLLFTSPVVFHYVWYFLT